MSKDSKVEKQTKTNALSVEKKQTKPTTKTTSNKKSVVAKKPAVAKKTTTAKKSTVSKKTAVAKKVESPKKDTKKETTAMKDVSIDNKVKADSERKSFSVPRDVLEEPNSSSIFDVFLYREIFMSLRTQFDALYEKRERSDKDFDKYDDAIYNITVSAMDNAGAQDFLSYCYKKGKYDFCLMNFEKFMKWSLLSAANGNAFALSKLQIFLTSAIDSLLSLDIHSYLLSFLDLTVENYIIFLSKLICDEMVKILEITPVGLIKMPEAYVEQSEELQRVFDNTKMKATDNVIEFLKKSNSQLQEYLNEKMEEENVLKKKAKLKSKNISEKETDKTTEDDEINKSKNPIHPVKKPTIKKFRW